MLFNEQGILDIDGMIANEPSFLKIMEDGIVTDEELLQQSNKVIDMLHEVEQRFNVDDQQFIKRLFAETNILVCIHRFYELKNLK